MLAVGVKKDDTALFTDGLRPAVVHVGGSMKSNARMTMIVVIPTEESRTVGVAVFVGAEAIGEVGSVLKRGAAFGFMSFRNYRIRSLLYVGKPNWDLLATVTPR